MRIRGFRPDDREFVLGLVPRLTEFGDVPGRDRGAMTGRDRAVLEHVMDHSEPDTALFVAENDGRRLGFVHLTTADDYYTNTTTAHIADVVVARDAGGQGVGGALIAFSEKWARDRGFDMLTLNVFVANAKARQLYLRLGFQEEWIRCIKRL